MDFANFIPAILGILGIQAFHEENGHKVLTAEEKAALKGYDFSDQFLADFEASLNAGAPKAKGRDEADKKMAVLSAVLGQTTAQLQAKSRELEAMQTSSQTTAANLKAKEAEIAELTAKVKTLSEMPEADPGANAGKASEGAAAAFNLDDDRQLGGRPGVMFGLDRPYNMRAKAALLARQGKVMAVNDVNQMDYKALQDDLGAFYRVPWRERLQSLLVELPSIEAIFPLESGYQDLATLVNVWLGEFSQADTSGTSKFDDKVKGSYSFNTETLRMYGVMFAHRFSNLKQIEQLWIGSLNREGSNPIKWSFIEFLLAETAKKLHNERELRRVNGVRRNPDVNASGRAMDAADGFYEFIRQKVDGHTDYTPDGGTTGKTVYQVKPFDLPEITPANIGEVFYEGTAMVPSQYRDTGKVVLYVPSYMIPWYHKYNEAKYGQNTDYKGNIAYVKEFPSVRLVAVPNADNHCRIVWTLEGNIKTYEGAPGEMLNFQIEQEDWSLKVWSNWKESVWAEAVGFKYTDPSAMDGSRQLIWCNGYDRPSTYFVDAEPDKNPSVLLHSSVVTAANSALFTITDIADALAGQVVTLKCGADGDAGVKISHSDKFSLLATDWTPAKGDTIKLMKRADGKFIEIGRTAASGNAYQFSANATSPSVDGATVFVTGTNTQATALTTLADAVVGTIYTIHGSGSTNATTIANSGNFVLTAAMTLSEGAMIKLVKGENGKFYEIERVSPQ